MKKKIKVVLVGAGSRGNKYASVSLEKPELFEVVGIVDPDPTRRKIIQDRYQVPNEFCFEQVEDFLKLDKFADAVINGTMDHLHVPTAIPILEKKYDMLLEKPFAINEDEMWRLVDTANRNNCQVFICHVLRYTPFYSSIKKRILNGEIGDVISIEMTEHVSYHHMAASFVRGKWRSEKVCHSTMLLQKCCHDMDIMMWMMNHTAPSAIASFGSNFQFVPEKKPKQAGSRCMLDCPLNQECPYSAEAHYIEKPRWEAYVWKCLEGDEDQSIERKKESLRSDNEYGKCVWDFERDGNVDHQSVIVTFQNGATGTFNLVGGAADGGRNIHILGTKGEIKGNFEECRYTIKKISPYGKEDYEEEIYDLEVSGDMSAGELLNHGGGDSRLVIDFIHALQGEQASISSTNINDSIISHRAVFLAEKSRKNGTIEYFDSNGAE